MMIANNGSFPAPSNPPTADVLNPAPGPAEPKPALDLDHPLRAICAEWIKKIEQGKETKKLQFGDDAAECMKFYHGAMDVLYDTEQLKKSAGFRRDAGDDNNFPAPTFQMQSNKVAECVQLFGPLLYHKNPYRQVNPRKRPDLPQGLFAAMAPTADPIMEAVMGPDPMQQQMLMVQEQALSNELQKKELVDTARAKLLEWYLNYTPRELGLRDETRMAIDEALIKGMGCLWTEITQPVDGGPRLVGSFYDTVDNLVLDPDAERIDDCKWIARRCIHPVWEVERMYGLPAGSLRGNLESYSRQADVSADEDGDMKRKTGVSNDLIVYWKIYSKMGIGARLPGVDARYRETLDTFGDYAFLAIAADIPYPLNCPDEKLSGPPAEVLKLLEWPTPYWMDGRWPMSPLAFHWVPRQLWPMCHFKPAMGELKALNWLYSLIISKIGITCRDFLAILESADQETKEAIAHGRDFTIIKLKATNPGTIDQMVQFLQHPQMNGDVWKVLEAIKEEFEKRTGLSELVYGMSSRQMRSAEEASVKSDQISVRPDDMANKVEDFAGEVAKNEALCVRWNIGVSDVEPLMGDAFAQYWAQLVVSPDPYVITRQLEYGIEAGSTKKPNKDRDADNMNAAMQNLFQPLLMYAQGTGVWTPVNALVTAWAKSIDLDPSAFLFPEMPPAPPPAPEQKSADGKGGGKNNDAAGDAGKGPNPDAAGDAGQGPNPDAAGDPSQVPPPPAAPAGMPGMSPGGPPSFDPSVFAGFPGMAGMMPGGMPGGLPGMLPGLPLPGAPAPLPVPPAFGGGGMGVMMPPPMDPTGGASPFGFPSY